MINKLKIIAFGYLFNPVIPIITVFITICVSIAFLLPVESKNKTENVVNFNKCSVVSIEQTTYTLDCKKND